jgi:hypothetical protein
VITCVVIVLCVPISRATTAIAIVDTDAIIIGTDSLWRWSKSGTALKCKINTDQSKCIYIIVGLRSKPETGFDSSLFANQACKAKLSPTKAAIFFGNNVREPLLHSLEYSRLNDPIVYKRDYQGKVALEVLFAGFEAAGPVVVSKSFSLDSNGILHESVAAVPDQKGNNIALSGQQEAALSFLKTQSNHLITDYPKLVRSLIEIEIKDKPNKVGGPVDVLVIKRMGHRWVAPYGTCGP